MKTSDIKITAVRTNYQHNAYRTMIKFGGVALDKATVINVECEVVTRDGKAASGFGSMPLSNIWAFPSREMDAVLGACFRCLTIYRKLLTAWV
ncbi:MAG: hypothetical protein L3J39_02445 [Verrucomicrobiales bacterium]|nr:hypothetical protein [Verrucomicrobiales bacterium]